MEDRMTGKWKKVAPALVELFDACLPHAAGVERRQMFGCPCAFVNGNMFTGLHETRLIVRLPETERLRLIGEAGAKPFVVMGRTMREYVVIEDALDRRPAEVANHMICAFNYARSLPAKTKASRLTKPSGAARARSAHHPISRRARRPVR
jgi:TfoX/Sxy family transcriptional regulator of competence genes